MGREIERKFLVKGFTWREVKGAMIRQGYLNSAKERNVTIKGIAVGASRLEFEYEVPLKDAAELLEICEKPLIEKRRYRVLEGGLIWEVDEFFGENEGLIVAEVELESEDQAFHKPDWVGEEVTGDTHYFNSNLIRNPYTNWS
jgi:CYTH domain-containing protein